jgi:hypothetical protein
MAFPSSQKPFARPVGFILDDKNQTGSDALTQFVFAPLVIRPEDLTRLDPSRTVAIQTMGGAWVDSFGPGISDIRISGTTGWRGGLLRDGIAEMLFLKETVFDAWHSRRADAIKQRKDPNNVRLVFIDRLDSIVAETVPTNFRLHRSKTSPLIAKYDLGLTIIRDGVEGFEYPTFQFGISELDDFVKVVADAIETIQSAISTAQQWLDTYVFAPISIFMGLSTQLFAAIMTIPAAIDGIYSATVGTVIATAQAGKNMIRAFTSLSQLPARAKADLIGAANAYETVEVCSIRATRRLASLPNYSDVYGASLCSSTSGGRPILARTGENLFETAQSRPSTPGSSAPSDGAMARLAKLDLAAPRHDAQMRADIRGAVDYVKGATA